MAIAKSPGLILQRIPFGDTSLILKVYTADHGLITLMAKGARNAKSKIRALTDFFLVIQCVFSLSGKGEMTLLQDAGLIEDLPALRQIPLKQSLAQLWLEAYLRFSPGNAESHERFDWLLQHLQSLDRSENPKDVTLLSIDFLLGFCSLNGFALQFQECAHCGNEIVGERIRLSLTTGGPVCNDCRQETGALHPLGRESMRLMAKGQEYGWTAMAIDSATALAAEKFFLAYLQHQSGEGRSLRSLEVYRTLRAN